MELTKEEVISNLKKYVDKAKKTGFLTDELNNYLGANGFITAPASAKVIHNNAFEGGLIDHIMKVMRTAYLLNNDFEDELKVPLDSLIKVVYLHQLGKCGLYVPNANKWRKDNLGEVYSFNDDITSMRVGERSAYIALKCGIELTDDEYIAIINYDKYDDAMAEHHNSTVGQILKAANMVAIVREKYLAKK